MDILLFGESEMHNHAGTRDREMSNFVLYASFCHFEDLFVVALKSQTDISRGRRN
jgi:hypothetical protein